MPMPEFDQLVEQVKKEITEIDAAELRRLQESGEEFTLIDVREAWESSQEAIPGSTAIPRGVLELDIENITTDKKRKIVCYCGGGARSALSAYMLQKMGFERVASLKGGYRGWKAASGK